MDNQTTFTNTSNTNMILIILLITIIVFSSLGINIVIMTGVLIQKTLDFFTEILGGIVLILGYITGSIINIVADVFGNSARIGVDIAEGTAHDIGDLLKNKSNTNPIHKTTFFNDEYYNQIKKFFNYTPYDIKTNPNIPILAENNKNIPPPSNPEPSTTENPVQKTISSSKTNWCLIGDYQGKKSCIEIRENEKCISEKTFSNYNDCII